MANTRLYGICREVGYCVDTCGLCARISGVGEREPHRRRAKPVFELPPLEPDEVAEIKPPPRRCDDCGKLKRSNHNCRANRPPKPLGRKPKIAGTTEPLAVSCGCLFLSGKRVKYCDKHFAERELSL